MIDCDVESGSVGREKMRSSFLLCRLCEWHERFGACPSCQPGRNVYNKARLSSKSRDVWGKGATYRIPFFGDAL